MVAVLLITYNRPETTKRVIEALLQDPPSRLYIGANGPRPDDETDRKNCAELRDMLMSIDWPCETITRFRDEHLGAAPSITGHIDWFFSHEDRGVILEDDCIVKTDLLRFFETLLEKYKDNPRVMSISGFTPLPQQLDAAASYYFSIFTLSWGWATWRRAWTLFRPTPDGLDQFLAADDFPGAARRPAVKARWSERFRTAEQNPGIYWFAPWIYWCWVNNGVHIMPYANLVRNLCSLENDKQEAGKPPPDGDKGFGKLDWPLRHPESLTPDDEMDVAFMREFYDLN